MNSTLRIENNSFYNYERLFILIIYSNDGRSSFMSSFDSLDISVNGIVFSTKYANQWTDLYNKTKLDYLHIFSEDVICSVEVEGSACAGLEVGGGGGGLCGLRIVRSLSDSTLAIDSPVVDIDTNFKISY